MLDKMTKEKKGESSLDEAPKKEAAGEKEKAKAADAADKPKPEAKQKAQDEEEESEEEFEFGADTMGHTKDEVEKRDKANKALKYVEDEKEAVSKLRMPLLFSNFSFFDLTNIVCFTVYSLCLKNSTI